MPMPTPTPTLMLMLMMLMQALTHNDTVIPRDEGTDTTTRIQDEFAQEMPKSITRHNQVGAFTLPPASDARERVGM